MDAGRSVRGRGFDPEEEELKRQKGTERGTVRDRGVFAGKERSVRSVPAGRVWTDREVRRV